MFNCYIDEAGDEGIKRGSKWFILAGLAVEDRFDARVSQVIRRINSQLGRQISEPFHWRDHRKHVSRKRLAADELAKEPVTLFYVAVDTTELNPASFRLGGHQVYRYFCRFLIERISWFVDDQGSRANLIFSNRASFSYTELERYIRWLIRDPNSEVRPVINTISAVQMSHLRLLQAADIAAGAAFDALEPDNLGYTDERFLQSLSHLMYRRKGKLYGYGFKVFGVSTQVFIENYPWASNL